MARTSGVELILTLRQEVDNVKQELHFNRRAILHIQRSVRKSHGVTERTPPTNKATVTATATVTMTVTVAAVVEGGERRTR